MHTGNDEVILLIECARIQNMQDTVFSCLMRCPVRGCSMEGCSCFACAHVLAAQTEAHIWVHRMQRRAKRLACAASSHACMARDQGFACVSMR